MRRLFRWSKDKGVTAIITGERGETSLTRYGLEEATARGERCLWLAYEESASQITRNMRSIGIDLEPAVRRGSLRIHAERATICDLEMQKTTALFTSLTGGGSAIESTVERTQPRKPGKQAMNLLEADRKLALREGKTCPRVCRV